MTPPQPIGAQRLSALTERVVDPSTLKAAYGCFPSGVVAICAVREGTPVGIVASTFTSVSLEPPLVSVCVQRSSTTWPLLRDRARLGLSVLSAGHGTTCRQIAARTGDRFAGVGWAATDDGAVLLDGAAAWLDTAIHEVLPAGDHELVLLRVHGVRSDPAVPPLVFHASNFRRLEVA